MKKIRIQSKLNHRAEDVRSSARLSEVGMEGEDSAALAASALRRSGGLPASACSQDKLIIILSFFPPKNAK